MSDEPHVPSIIEQMFGKNFKFKEFVPHTYYHEAMNFLEYLEEDCCMVTEYIKGSNIELMRKWDGEKYCGIVGIKIHGFSQVAPPEVVEAYRSYNERRRREWEEEINSGGLAESG